MKVAKKIIFDKIECESYKGLYKMIYRHLNGNKNWDFDFCGETLGYDGNILNEFLWYYHNEGLCYVFKGFDIKKIKEQKNTEDYNYNIIFTIFENFVKCYPNNEIIFIYQE